MQLNQLVAYVPQHTPDFVCLSPNFKVTDVFYLFSKRLSFIFY